jgi:hypothetical protein
MYDDPYIEWIPRYRLLIQVSLLTMYPCSLVSTSIGYSDSIFLFLLAVYLVSIWAFIYKAVIQYRLLQCNLSSSLFLYPCKLVLTNCEYPDIVFLLGCPYSYRYSRRLIPSWSPCLELSTKFVIAFSRKLYSSLPSNHVLLRNCSCKNVLNCTKPFPNCSPE